MEIYSSIYNFLSCSHDTNNEEGNSMERLLDSFTDQFLINIYPVDWPWECIEIRLFIHSVLLANRALYVCVRGVEGA